MALTVTLSGTTNIEQGQQTTLSAEVRDSNNNVITAGLTYAWTANRGAFVGAVNQASATYHADFTDANDVDVDIACAVSLAANPNPTVSGPSLTALSELGITGIVANLLITDTANVTPSSAFIYETGDVGTADPNSDFDVTADIRIFRIRWFVNTSRLTLNQSGSGSWMAWSNPNMSIFAVAPSGAYVELPSDEADGIGGGFIRWDIDTSQHAAFAASMDGIDSGDTFLVGVGDSDSIGLPGDSGSGMSTVTARAAMMVTPVATTLQITGGNNQSAQVGTAIADSLTVRVLDQNGSGFSGASVTFSTSGGSLSQTSAITNASGHASTKLTLGNTAGTYTVTARVAGLTDVVFTATATAIPPPPPTPPAGPSIHNTFLFRECQNYKGNGSRVERRGTSTQVRTVADNDYATSSAVTDYDVDISDGSNPTQVDAIVVKYTGDITEYEATPTGGTGSAVTRTVPDEVMDIRGQTVSLEVGGLKHDLFLLDSDAFTATSVRMQFQGSNIRIVEIMLLELVQEIDATTSDFVAWQPEQTDRTGRIDVNPGGRLSKVNGSGRERRNVELTIRITPGKTKIESVDEFLYDLERNKRIVFVEAFSENPSFIYPAVIASLRIPIEYRRPSYKPLGYNVPLLIRES